MDSYFVRKPLLQNQTPFPNGRPQAAVGVLLSSLNITSSLERISDSFAINILSKRRKTLTFTIKLVFETLD